MLRSLLNVPIQSELRQTTEVDKASAIAFGLTAFNDTLPRVFYFDANSLATDNNSTILKPTDLLTTEPGRWIFQYTFPTSNSVSAPSINTTPGRALNTNFTPSASKIVLGVYSITCSVTNPLLAGSSTVTAYLEYSTNSGTTWTALTQNGNSSSVALAVAIAITNGQTATLTGAIQAGALARIRTVVTGTASATLIAQHELTL